MSISDNKSSGLDPELVAILRGVIDPELNNNIVDLGMVKNAIIDGDGVAQITVALTTSGCPLRSQIKTDVQRKISSNKNIEEVKVTFGELNAQEKRTLMDSARKNARENAIETAVSSSTRVIAIASGKGGVGKSSITANLASAIADLGFKVGVLDADIWGFSQGTMLGVAGRLEGTAGKIDPHLKVIGKQDGELKIVSMGFLIDLILAKAVEQFLVDVNWGELDYLFIDMPPGTGDIQMAVSRLIPQSEMLVVTTPARGAQTVAARVGDMAQRSYMPILGVVENMSYFVSPSGEKFEIFGNGGGSRLAKRLATTLLAQIPLEPGVTEANSAGVPIVISDIELENKSPAAIAMRDLAKNIVDNICPPIEMAGCTSIKQAIFKQMKESKAQV